MVLAVAESQIADGVDCFNWHDSTRLHHRSSQEKAPKFPRQSKRGDPTTAD